MFKLMFSRSCVVSTVSPINLQNFAKCDKFVKCEKVNPLSVSQTASQPTFESEESHSLAHPSTH